MHSITTRRILVAAATLVATAASFLATAPAANAILPGGGGGSGGSCLTQAANPKANPITYAQATYAAPADIRLIFARDPFGTGNSLDGRLSVFYSVGTTRCEVTVHAGSGQLGLSACVARGPMPTGDYTVTRASRVSNSTVQSVAWDLHMNGYGPNQAKATGCTGTAALRTELMLHSEMKVSPINYAGSYVPYSATVDSTSTWDNGQHDWYSLGCLKIEPYAIDLLNRITSTDPSVYRAGSTVPLTVRMSPVATL